MEPQTFIRGLWSSKISPVAGPAGSSNHHKPFKLGFQNFVRGRPSQNHRRDNLVSEKSVTGRPSKDHEPYQIKPENFICGSSKHHEPCNLELAGSTKTMSLTKWSSKISSAAGPVKTTNQNLEYENMSLAGPAKTMSLTKWIRGRPSQDYKPGNLQHENSVSGRPSKDYESYRVFQKSRPQTCGIRTFCHLQVQLQPFFLSNGCMAQRRSLSGRSPFCQH